MKVLVCGPRDWTNRQLVYRVLDNQLAAIGLDALTVISGCARGVDTFAIEWAELAGQDAEKYPAEWSIHGRAAGPIRNRRMLDEGKPDKVIAFGYAHRRSLTVGTRDMVTRAERARVPVEIHYA
jgi:hypothetical protein